MISVTITLDKGRFQQSNFHDYRMLRMDQVPTAKVAEYSGEDADVALRLCGLVEAAQHSLEGLRYAAEDAVGDAPVMAPIAQFMDVHTYGDEVDAFHAKALELGGTDEGAPGERTPGVYFAYFRDLDGNKLCGFKLG